MSVEVAFFMLRSLIGIALLVFLFALFYLLWRTLNRPETPTHSYGRLYRSPDAINALQEGDTLFPLRPITTLGRSASNSIVISDDYASAEHARIILRSGQWWLEDCGSRNGTALNDKDVSAPVILSDGDVIGVGRSRFRLELDN